MNSNEILKNETKKLLEGSEELHDKFTDLTDVTTAATILVSATSYFDDRSEECNPLIENCDKSLNALPKFTPPTSKIKRSQYENVKQRLENLKSSFVQLQEKTDTVTSTTATVAEKGVAAGEIVLEVPSILDDFTFMILECEEIKKVLNF